MCTVTRTKPTPEISQISQILAPKEILVLSATETKFEHRPNLFSFSARRDEQFEFKKRRAREIGGCRICTAFDPSVELLHIGLHHHSISTIQGVRHQWESRLRTSIECRTVQGQGWIFLEPSLPFSAAAPILEAPSSHPYFSQALFG